MAFSRDPIDIHARARGQWRTILERMGLDPSYLTGRHGPCPVCNDGVDRFRFDDLGGKGTFFCSKCGSGDGMRLAGALRGNDWGRAYKEVREILGVGDLPVTPVAPEVSDQEKIAWARRLWAEAVRITPGDPADLYLISRGVGDLVYPSTLRYHPRLRDARTDTHHPGLLAAIWTPDKQKGVVGVQRIYLNPEGRPAPIDDNKRTLGILPPRSCVPLGRCPDGRLGIAEGVVTALWARRRFGMPVWAAISAGGLTRWTPPSEVRGVPIREVHVFGDNDESYTGQLAATKLAHDLKAATSLKLTVDLHIPRQTGLDWADEGASE